MQVKHKPTTALPFTTTAHFIDARDPDGKLRSEKGNDGNHHSIATCHGAFGEQHARYLSHAGNAYPRLVQALRAVTPVPNGVDKMTADELRAILRARSDTTFTALRNADEDA